MLVAGDNSLHQKTLDTPSGTHKTPNELSWVSQASKALLEIPIGVHQKSGAQLYLTKKILQKLQGFLPAHNFSGLQLAQYGHAHEKVSSKAEILSGKVITESKLEIVTRALGMLRLWSAWWEKAMGSGLDVNGNRNHPSRQFSPSVSPCDNFLEKDLRSSCSESCPLA